MSEDACCAHGVSAACVLITAAVETEAIRAAKRSVERVSSPCRSSGQMLAISAVLQLPPSDSRRTW